jgi:hypothetical protein
MTEDPGMIKKCFIAVLTAALFIPLYAQDKGKKDEKKPADDKQKMTVWQEVVLEDFEATVYTDKNLSFNVTSDQEGKASIRDQLAATDTSKKYLGVKMKTRGGDVFIIKPSKDWIIDKYTRSVSFWIYGKKTEGILSFLLQDTRQQTHLLQICAIDFLGWKKVTVNLGNRIAQSDDFLNQKKTMKILQLQYRTAGSKERPSQWQYLYIDDITATVRERYNDKQSDEW